jgi:glycerate 2-kinase
MKDDLLNGLREDAISLFDVGIKAALPYYLIPNNILLEDNVFTVSDVKGKSAKFDLDKFKRIIIIGAGKASTSMALELENIIGDRIDDGLVVTKYGFTTELDKIRIIEAGHPLPDNNGIKASKKIVEICKKTKEDDLIINLISGGASALLPFPAADLLLEDKIEITELLLKSDAAIQEINTVRKHLSEIKGGQLVKYVYPATMINLIISDTIGDKLDVIGSGMTVPDPTTFEESWEILKNYDLLDKISAKTKQHLLDGIDGKIQETPKPGNNIFSNVYNYIIGNNEIALSAIKTSAEKIGYEAKIITSELQGEARETGKFIAKVGKDYSKKLLKPTCLIFGGETTVIVKGNGKGGRNQELCLSVALEIDGTNNITFLSAGTDGNDGQTEAAGAICNDRTIERANELGLDAIKFLNNNDSYNFFKKLSDLIITGPTNTNVMDVQIILLR